MNRIWLYSDIVQHLIKKNGVVYKQYFFSYLREIIQSKFHQSDFMTKSIISLKNSSSFLSEITVGKHKFVSDEPVSVGGEDKGPNPIELTMAALGACTTMTIKLYLDQKKWAFSSVDVEVSTKVEKIENAAILNDLERPLVDNGRLRRIHKKITVAGSFDENQKERILNIAGKCPVNKMLAKSAYITDDLNII